MKISFEKREVSGDPAKGLVIFTGGIRFWGVPYGRQSIPRGLRTAGFKGRVIYWPWHEKHDGSPGKLSLPALWDKGVHDRHAHAIARYFAHYTHEYPDQPTALMGCSAGGTLVVRVMQELVKDYPEVQLNGAALLSAAVWPGREDIIELAEQCLKSGGKLVNYHSVLDCIILGAGTLLFGTGDRKKSLSCGMIGLKHTREGLVENMPFRLEMTRHGRFGGHNSAIRSEFISKIVVPELGL